MRMRDRVRGALGEWSSRSPLFRGKTRLVRGLDRLLGAGPVPEVERGGVRWRLDTSELIQFGIFYHGAYGRGVIEALSGLVTARGGGPLVLWDVGANIGAVSLPLLARLPNLRIEAFEPAPSVLAQLRTQVGLNPRLAERLRLHPLALSSEDAALPFFESGSSGNRGVGSLLRMHNTVPTGATVDTASGDALIARGGAAPPDVLKIDVEGWELNVLQGLSQTLTERRPDVIMEYEAYRHAASGRTSEDFKAFFRACGYTRFDAVTARGGFEAPGARASFDLVARA
jgi:FkbM family methyltransferase